MDFVKKYRKTILICILYIALFGIGKELYHLFTEGLDNNLHPFIRTASLDASILLAIGCFWELYFSKRSKTIYK